jgi:hypothetical protein
MSILYLCDVDIVVFPATSSFTLDLHQVFQMKLLLPTTMTTNNR